MILYKHELAWGNLLLKFDVASSRRRKLVHDEA